MTRNRTSHAPHTCDRHLTRAFAFLGKRWNGMLIGALSGGPASFAELCRGVPGISESVLSDRLSELAAAGLVRREVDEGPPVGVHLPADGRGPGVDAGSEGACPMGARPPARTATWRRPGTLSHTRDAHPADAAGAKFVA